MKKSIIIIIVITFFGIIFIANTLFTVGETEQVIITQFGEPVRSAIKTAGLKAKIPFIQKVHFFEKRIMEWDG
ncbi:MAG: protease modulator HflC, partial [Candidatus Cloacimonetes bacterium]|nr:protease modulator HflC [Candidatus Cloacimonadota bacterium]